VAEAKDITGLSLQELVEVERVEAELDGFIEKRAREARDQERTDELWPASVWRDRKKRRQQNAQAWFEYHDHIIRSHEATLGFLISYHKQERARFAQILDLPEIGQGGEEA
jgi:hypothetical protein